MVISESRFLQVQDVMIELSKTLVPSCLEKRNSCWCDLFLELPIKVSSTEKPVLSSFSFCYFQFREINFRCLFVQNENYSLEAKTFCWEGLYIWSNCFSFLYITFRNIWPVRYWKLYDNFKNYKWLVLYKSILRLFLNPALLDGKLELLVNILMSIIIAFAIS